MPDQATELKSVKTMACIAVLFAVAAFVVSVMTFIMNLPSSGPTQSGGPVAHVQPAPSTTSGAASSPPAAPAHTPAYVPAGRSPLAQPGETIVKPIPLQTPQQVTAAQPAPPPAGQAVPWNEAARYVGQSVTVEGAIVATHNTGSVCFLNFTTEPRGGDKFYLITFKDNFGDWPAPPEVHFLNKTVRATGRIDLHNGRPQLKVKDKQQIEIIK